MIVLDTHVAIWLALKPEELSRTAANEIRTAGGSGGLGIAAISLWEIAWLVEHGRVQYSGTAEAFLRRLTSRLSVLPINVEIAALANQLSPEYPADPCDRLIGATALSVGAALVTKDKGIRASRQVHTIW